VAIDAESEVVFRAFVIAKQPDPIPVDTAVISNEPYPSSISIFPTKLMLDLVGGSQMNCYAKLDQQKC